MNDEKPIWTDQDDAEIGYGKEVSLDVSSFLAEVKKLYPARRVD